VWEIARDLRSGSTPEVDPPRLGANDETVLGVGGMGEMGGGADRRSRRTLLGPF